MPSTLFNLDAANLFVGDDDPTRSQFLALKSIKIPGLEEQTKEHTGGGAIATLSLGMRVFKVSPLTFTLEGPNPDVLPSFMSPAAARKKYTIRGNVRDVRTHDDIELRAIVEGRMTKIEISEYKKDDGITSDYEINEITFYHLFFKGAEKIYYEFFSGPAGLRIDGAPALQGVARNLGIA